VEKGFSGIVTENMSALSEDKALAILDEIDADGFVKDGSQAKPVKSNAKLFFADEEDEAKEKKDDGMDLSMLEDFFD